MFSTKVLPALACALMVASVAVNAQPKMKATHPQAVSSNMPSADLDLSAESPGADAAAHTRVASQAAVSQSTASQTATVTPVTAAPASATVPSESRLSIEDVDRIARSSIARQLAGNGNALPGGVALNGAAPAAAPATAPAPPANSKPAPVRSRAEPVRFVGAFSDVSGQSVLYEYRNASYPAHVGARLLNGWTVKRVDGFVVTVADGTGKGARTWTETISGGTPAQDVQQSGAGGLAVRGLPDLSGPLPPNIPLSAIAR
ncbi:hypothetical protein LMG28727_06088 [Paraburkholderia kirstenboschensis]|uniref:hypothetical protein n=1 Tax=Paraburkholderia kirstenboschensis TaxID=1245436 RepID=UPI000B1AFEC3|nr:hypothetical protein [Paraburkholderia kirstenboschensis]CAD6556395.1 hypothetical protein LMG28727_06088 [Paraburkholderia kirstenboschensis]